MLGIMMFDNVVIVSANETTSNDRTIGETPQKFRAVDSSSKSARATETPNRTRILQSKTVCETPKAGDGVTPVPGDDVTPVMVERTLQMGHETPISRVMNSTAISGDSQGRYYNYGWISALYNVPMCSYNF